MYKKLLEDILYMWNRQYEAMDREKLETLQFLRLKQSLEQVYQLVAFECSAKAGLHISEDHFIPEIIDPDSGQVLPEGSTGELAITTISKEALPMLSWLNRKAFPAARAKRSGSLISAICNIIISREVVQ